MKSYKKTHFVKTLIFTEILRKLIKYLQKKTILL